MAEKPTITIDGTTYEATGEFREAKDGEFYLNDTTGAAAFQGPHYANAAYVRQGPVFGPRIILREVKPLIDPANVLAVENAASALFSAIQSATAYQQSPPPQGFLTLDHAMSLVHGGLSVTMTESLKKMNSQNYRNFQAKTETRRARKSFSVNS